MNPQTINVTRIAAFPATGAERPAVASGVRARASHDHSPALALPFPNDSRGFCQSHRGGRRTLPVAPRRDWLRLLRVCPLIDVVVSEKVLFK